MAEENTAQHVPMDVPLPPVPTRAIFTTTQWRTLLALADAVIPSIRSPVMYKSKATKIVTSQEMEQARATLISRIPSPDAATIAGQYLRESASSNNTFRESLQRLFSFYVHDEGLNGIKFILNALNTRPGSLLLTGSPILIRDQSVDVREEVFRSWETARLKPLRAVYRALSAIFKKTWISTSPTLNLALGFPRVPVYGKPVDGFKYEFLQFPPGDDLEIIETDVIIVGSGCGGSVAAKNLTEAGYRVMVVDKSYHYTSNHFPMDANEGFISMFEAGGGIVSDDGSTVVLAGSTWGGGGTVNWSAALQTQGYVRQEWAKDGLSFFTSQEFQKCLDRVCDRMGVGIEHIEHNKANRLILEGARRLGYSAKTVPQNTGQSLHYCGYCTLGCHTCGKKGPTETFLADASRGGATFIEGFRADKILFEQKPYGTVASGVEGTWTSRDSYLGLTGLGAVKRKVVIKAKRVVVSCGSLQSPLLLMRSGLKNRRIGRNLHLHPVVVAGAVLNEEVRPWEGSALTTVVNEFENLDQKGHGVKIEALSMLPSAYLPLFPWRGGLDYKLWVLNLARSVGFITLTRDRDGGRVYPDPVDGRCRIEYTPSAYDRKHMLEALIGAAHIAFVAGAKEFHTTWRELAPYIRPEMAPAEAAEGTNSASFQAWLADIRAHKVPLAPERTQFASAHQMGTCRMGTSPKTSVVDPDCQVWETRSLYVVDASVFPSASGVNPMITNMAIADWASRNIAKSLGDSREVHPMARL
ncbi:long chain fatty alcohol oxidase [Aspergillus saccharolyticus JOP 1030-1]|uniref:Long-chain-alcohol oxidase n=1 Tax=Aspergillus saccharolyticus JOP 1030-1 TaxID=1450539 RepID=A0A318ZS30_9EURO|nr:long chain fatty alcohol oxidase [Aspergillus saccharolyticus JOP 1030-1]PYH49424.1 long chain fatty alcohol oxidase [Aspergillus saccharolyticus JOP 1030-1]